MGKDDSKNYLPPLFETKAARGRIGYLLYLISVMVGLCLIIVYRLIHLPPKGTVGRWAWIGLFVTELCFSLYWIITQSVRWNPSYRYTFKQRLSQRYEKVLPKVDIFVCTADPTAEPPIMVINTVLSLMAYDFPTEKLNVYLSDDGGSDLTFYALLEASRFSKHWLPFCKKFKIEPRSPAAYFSTLPVVPSNIIDPVMAKQWSSIKKLYEDMKTRIVDATKLGQIPEKVRQEHKGFQEWDSVSSKRDHQTILQILIDGRNPNVVDIEEQPLPTLVYLAREKRPQYHHNYKAGSLNSLIRVSSQISNAPLILHVDCDMYSNNSESLRDALCFHLDEKNGHNIAYVQFPQTFNNLTKNDIYSSSLRIIMEVDLVGMDSNGGPLSIGTGCFHKRLALSGKTYSKDIKIDWKVDNNEESTQVLEQTCKDLANCSYELENPQWGKEMGLMYGCPVEDVLTGISIKCRGWRGVYFNSERKGFLGLAPTTLLQTLVQHKRWSDGDFQIFLSKYNPFIIGHGKISFMLKLAYNLFLLWAPTSFAALYYILVPSLCIHRGIPLFPKLSSPWVLSFALVILARYGYSLCEFLCCGGTFLEWWNDQRMWVFKRTTSHLFAFIDNMLKLLGLAKAGFDLTEKVADEDVSLRYEKEIMEFGVPSPMFNIIATLSLTNLFSFVRALKKVTSQPEIFDQFAIQTLLCAVLVLINLPVYEAIFFRKDKGRMPVSVTYQSVMIAILAHMVT